MAAHLFCFPVLFKALACACCASQVCMRCSNNRWRWTPCQSLLADTPLTIHRTILHTGKFTLFQTEDTNAILLTYASCEPLQSLVLCFCRVQGNQTSFGAGDHLLITSYILTIRCLFLCFLSHYHHSTAGGLSVVRRVFLCIQRVFSNPSPCRLLWPKTKQREGATTVAVVVALYSCATLVLTEIQSDLSSE